MFETTLFACGCRSTLSFLPKAVRFFSTNILHYPVRELSRLFFARTHRLLVIPEILDLASVLLRDTQLSKLTQPHAELTSHNFPAHRSFGVTLDVDVTFPDDRFGSCTAHRLAGNLYRN